MKKLFALLLALMMVFGLGVTAYAEDSTAAMDDLATLHRMFEDEGP